MVKRVIPVLQTLNLQDNAINALADGVERTVVNVTKDGQETNVTHVPENLDLLDNVIAVWKDGLARTVVIVLKARLDLNVMAVLQGGLELIVVLVMSTLDPLDGLVQNVMLVTDLDSALRVTALNVSRIATGKELFVLSMLMFI